MSPGASPLAAAVPGLTRSDPRSPGITRERSREGFRYRDPSCAQITEREALQRIGALASDNGLDTLFSYQDGGSWRILHSHDVSNYIAARAGGHFTAKEFRTWNATVLMALAPANTVPSPAADRACREYRICPAASFRSAVA